MYENSNYKLIKLQKYFICLVPIGLIIGPFASDFFLVLGSLSFLILSFKIDLSKYYKNKFLILFWFYCLFLLILSLSSQNILLSLESSLFYFRYGFFVMCIWFLLDFDKSFIKFFGYTLIASFALIFIDSFIQFFFSINSVGLIMKLFGYSEEIINFYGYTYSGHRLSSFFGKELILGSYLSRLLPLLFAFVIYIFSKSRYMSFYVLIVFILTNLIVYLSGERLAFFYIILISLIFLLLLSKWKLIRFGAVIFSIVIIFFISLSNSSIKERMFDRTFEQLNFKSNYYGSNMNIFSIQHEVVLISAYKIFLDNPIFGVGPKIFREECKKPEYQVFHNKDASINGCQTHPHNIYIQLLSETGIIGTIPILFIFLFISYLFFKQFIYLYFYKKIFISDYKIFLYTGIFISLWPLAPAGNFFNNWISIIYFLPIGFLLRDYNKKQL